MDAGSPSKLSPLHCAALHCRGTRSMLVPVPVPVPVPIPAPVPARYLTQPGEALLERKKGTTET